MRNTEESKSINYIEIFISFISYLIYFSVSQSISPLDILVETHLALRRGNPQASLLIPVFSFFFPSVSFSPEEHVALISLSMVVIDLYLM